MLTIGLIAHKTLHNETARDVRHQQKSECGRNNIGQFANKK